MHTQHTQRETRARCRIALAKRHQVGAELITIREMTAFCKYIYMYILGMIMLFA